MTKNRHHLVFHSPMISSLFKQFLGEVFPLTSTPQLHHGAMLLPVSNNRQDSC